MNLRQFTIDFKEGLESIRKLAKKYTVAKKCCVWENMPYVLQPQM